jgi:hypothetical protein
VNRPQPREALSSIREPHLLVEDFLRRYIVLESDQTLALALWVLHTWAFDAALLTPYIGVTSPTMRAGKTRLFEVLELVVRTPARTSSITPAALYRTISTRRPTLLLDETDASRISEQLRAILNDGYHVGGKVTRAEKSGSAWIDVDYPTFCAKAFAGIGSPLPPTVMDRSIPIRLKRRAPDEPVDRFRRRDAELDAVAIKNALVRWAEENVEALAVMEPDIPAELNDRAADVWEPLLAIADLTGCSDRARRAAVHLSGTEDEPDLGIQLLIDIHSVYLARAGGDAQLTLLPLSPRIPSTELVGALRGLDDPAFEPGYGAVRAADLARRLKPFGIGPKVLRVGAASARGYEWAAFEDAWRRYLSEPSQP